jgi:hypothetical protein
MIVRTSKGGESKTYFLQVPICKKIAGIPLELQFLHGLNPKEHQGIVKGP